MTKLWNLFVSEESGQGMVEYGLIVALIAVACIVAFTALSGGIQGVLNQITGELVPNQQG